MEHYLICPSCTESPRGGYKPQVKVNNVYIYHTERNSRTERGAMAKAKKLALSLESSLLAIGHPVTLSTQEADFVLGIK